MSDVTTSSGTMEPAAFGKPTDHDGVASWLLPGTLILSLCLTSLYSYAVFHTVAEVFGIVVSWGVFVLAWNTRQYMKGDYLLRLGIVLLCTSVVDTIHLMAYKGVALFPGYDNDLPTSLWIVSRYLQSGFLLVATAGLSRAPRPASLTVVAPFFAACVVATLLLVWSVFVGVFPACFVEGAGLTAFKKGSELVIAGLFVASGLLLWRHRSRFSPYVARLLVASVIAGACAELFFIFYVSVYGLSNLLGHALKTASSYLLYRAVVRKGLRQPMELLFSQLNEKAVELEKEVVERREAEGVAVEIDERFSTAFDSAPTMIAISELDSGRFIDVNRRFLDTFGFRKEEIIGHSSVEIGLFSADYRERLMETMRRGGSIRDTELPLSTREGGTVLCRYWAEPITVAGKKCLLSIALDVTEQRKVEEQFVQAQKMESVGRLAGGVAHDFNNMLGVIIGHAEIALMESEPGNPLRKDMAEILDAARRSADITRQLLAFARRQAIEPKVIDLNDSLAGMLKMLRRLIGEDVELTWNPGYELGKVRIDPSQLDQMMANLCVNARDAIVGIGKIDIVTENVVLPNVKGTGPVGVPPGEYVVLSVKDNGCGMEPEVLAHIFEPFFTTKGLGQGTGLGLATVFGIVQQNGGQIEVNSKPGRGTTFKVYLPRVTGHLANEPEMTPSLAGGAETILIVEDERAILNVASNMLSRLGYTVLTANSPAQAMNLADEHRGRIDLLLTDIIMPGMNGNDLHEKLRVADPGLRCLFMSGYTADVMTERGSIREGTNFIQKPFSMSALAAKVREALSGGAPQAG